MSQWYERADVGNLGEVPGGGAFRLGARLAVARCRRTGIVGPPCRHLRQMSGRSFAKADIGLIMGDS